jgi:phosphohistidine phosphatase
MKSLIVLRHAKSSWTDPELTDQERPLKKRGRKASVLIGDFLRDQRLKPDLVLCSTARRAVETVELVLETAGFDVETKYDDRLYLATPTLCVEVVAEVDSRKKRVLLVGHNPGLEDLLNRLTGVRELMPTAALAEISCPVEKWSGLATKRDCTLERLVRPRELIAERLA